MKAKSLWFASFLVLPFSLNVLPCYAQKQANNWFFGSKAGITFINGIPQALPGQVNSSEGSATISSATSGQLLFYTDGVTVWNRSQGIMTNGTGLKGHSSSTQSAVILPFPQDTNKFYIFTVDAIENKLANGLKYSVVDMTQQSGLGAVTVKNIHLLDTVAEKITAVLHSNGTDYWVIVKKWNSDAYYTFRVSAAGVSSPVVSHTGVYLSGNNWKSIGYMKFSPDGRMLAAANLLNNNYELFDFNSTTGVLSNARVIPSKFSGAYGVEFSPDGSQLYTSGWDQSNNRIWQYNLKAGSLQAVISSAVEVGLSASIQVGTMQLGPDGKIYIARKSTPWLGVIMYPNQPGTACSYVDNGVSLGNKKCDFGLPGFIQSYFKGGFYSERFCKGDSTRFSSVKNTGGLDSVKWIFGDPASGLNNIGHDSSAYHVFADSGNYLVKLILFKAGHSDTSSKWIRIYRAVKPELGNDIFACNVDAVKLSAGSGYVKYHWSTGTGDNLAESSVKTDGSYSVQVTDLQSCTSSDTINVTITRISTRLPADTLICKNTALSLNAYNPGASYQWSTDDTSSVIQVADSGTFYVTISKNNCTYVDTAHIRFYGPENLGLGKDISTCNPAFTILKTSYEGSNYVWSTGDTTGELVINGAGKYWVRFMGACGLISDTITVSAKGKVPHFSLGQDKVLCDSSLRIDLSVPLPESGYTFKWSHTGQNTNQVMLDKAGLYSVSVSNQCDTLTDSISVTYASTPEYSLGQDTAICGDFQLPLSVPAGYSVIWENGSKENNRMINKTGTYSVHVSNACGSVTDTLHILAKTSTLLNVIPNVFTPNGDSLNELFPFDPHQESEEFSRYHLMVFDRWGAELFSTKESGVAWDGKREGTDCAEGVYFFKLGFKTCDGKEKDVSGVVNLIR